MLEIREVLRLHYDVHLSNRDVARALGITHGTVGQCVQRFEAAGGTWPLSEEQSDRELRQWLYPGNLGRPRSRPDPDWAAIHHDLRRHKSLTLQRVWTEYKEVHPDGYQYTQFVDHYHQYVRSIDVAYRRVYHPGEQMQVDFVGDTLPIYDGKGNVVQRAALFVAVLPYSNFTFVGVYPDQTLASWIGGHVAAFTAFGGVPRMVVPDNPKPLVIDTRGDVVLHPTYQDLGRHYHCGLVPARVRKPKDKPKAEGHVLIVERWILMALRHVPLQSRGDAQTQVTALTHLLNTRPFQKLPGCRRELWETVERATLQPLPAEPYVLAELREARVGRDYHVHVDYSAYSVPYHLVGQVVQVRLTASTVECFADHQRVASHRRAARRGTWSTRPEHMPPHHRAVLKGWSSAYFLDQAALIGPQTHALMEAILAAAVIPEQQYTRCRGILRLAQEFTPAILEVAAQRAIHAEVNTVKAIKTLCMVVAAEPPVESGTLPGHANTRGAAYCAGPRTPEPQGE
jgi:transposase